MIEKRFKSHYDDRFQSIKKLLASYTNLICNTPENFEITLSPLEVSKELTRYITETESDELNSFFNDVVKYSEGEITYTKTFFNYIFDIINQQNYGSTPNVNFRLM